VGNLWEALSRTRGQGENLLRAEVRKRERWRPRTQQHSERF
jgi:hypothetical protein